MNVPRTYPARKLKKILKKHGIDWIGKGGKGGHGIFQGKDVNGDVQKYPLPSGQHKKEVTRTYLHGLLRRFGLNEQILYEK